MRGLPIKCTSCGSNIIVDDDVDRLICGCCLEAIDLEEARKLSRSKEPPEFLIRNRVLEAYFGASPYDIRIPSGVRKIASFAFAPFVRSVVIPEGVEEIAAGAFPCAYLEYIKLPDSLTDLGEANPKDTSYSKAFMLKEMVDSPVRPTIVCSPTVKRLLMDSVEEEDRDAVERGILWK